MNVVVQNHSSYPCAGDATSQDAAQEATRAPVQIVDVVRDQERAGVDVVTDGQIGWQDPISCVSSALDGVVLGEQQPYFATGRWCRRPIVTGAVSRRGALQVDKVTQ